MQWNKVFVVGVLPVFLMACGSGSALYEKTDNHLILPCYQEENSCVKKMTDRCVNALSGSVVSTDIRREDVPVAYVQCRPPQADAEGEAGA